MSLLKLGLVLTALTGVSRAQSGIVYVPDTCTEGFTGGVDTALFTIPYTYDQTMSIIGSYKNLTWSGNPDDTVTLNGTDNTVGTSRTYDIAGAHVIETILVYSKPPAPGPYNEVHNTALLTVPSYNVSLYIPYDGTVVTSICDGKASQFNFTARYCASNATVGGALLHALHTSDAMMVGTFLGGQNFTTCDAITSPNATTTSSSPVATYTSGAGMAKSNGAAMMGIMVAAMGFTFA